MVSLVIPRPTIIATATALQETAGCASTESSGRQCSVKFEHTEQEALPGTLPCMTRLGASVIANEQMRPVPGNSVSSPASGAPVSYPARKASHTDAVSALYLFPTSHLNED